MIRSLRTPLTTAAQDVETIGATAVEWLQRRIRGRDYAPALAERNLRSCRFPQPAFGGSRSAGDVEGFRYKDIADVTGMPVGTVMSRVHRGRQLLRKSLAGLALE
jgi:sigma-70-like protein